MRRFFFFALLLLAAPVQAEVYLCPTDGDGSDANPYRSRALSELLDGRGNVDLRDDVSQPGLMLCESDTLPTNSVGVVPIGADRASPVSAQTRAAIIQATGRAVSAFTAEAIIKELVLPRIPRPLGGKDYEIILSPSKPAVKEVASLATDLYYKGLAATIKERGVLAANAVLDGLVSVAHALTLTTETFDCANAAPIGTCVHAWVPKNATGIDIVSNQASKTGVLNYADDYLNAAVSTVDHEFSAIFVNASHGGGGTNTTCSLTGRNTADTNHTYYRVVVAIQTTGELNSVQLFRTVSATSTSLAVDTTDHVANDRLAVRMVGTTISAHKNGAQILSVTDPPGSGGISTGNYGGLRYFSDGTSSNCTWDNVIGRDITTARRKASPWFN